MGPNLITNKKLQIKSIQNCLYIYFIDWIKEIYLWHIKFIHISMRFVIYFIIIIFFPLSNKVLYIPESVMTAEFEEQEAGLFE